MRGEPANGCDEGEAQLRARIVDARPIIDAIRAAVMRARVQRALFGASVPVEVGRYRLERELGHGGGGSVFVARDPDLGRELAVKVIAASDPVRRDRAVAEAQALARLAHPHVVAAFDVGIAADRVFVAMELVDGESLHDYATHATRADIARAYRQAGEGLAAIHGAGLVHGDFKPANAVVGKDGRVRVVDLGLAGCDGDPYRGGTPGYLAPEAGGEATAAADQYAFGVAYRESMLRATGTVPRRLAAVIRRATQDDPRLRYATMTDLLFALDAVPRRRAAWVAAALSAATLLGATTGPLERRRATIAVPTQVFATATAPYERGAAAFARGDYATAAREFRIAYEAYPAAEMLWDLAVATDRTGDCREALRLFEIYLIRVPEPSVVEQRTIERARGRCPP